MYSPEVLDIEPRVLTITKMPMGISVIKINFPFNLRHLSQYGITRAWVIANTQKSVMTVVGKEKQKIDEIKQMCLDLLYKNHPHLPKKGVHTSISYNVALGAKPRPNFSGSFKYIGNVQATVRDLDDCGFSDIPLLSFVLPLDENSPSTEWIQFTRKADGFVAVSIGSRYYNKFTHSQLKQILAESPTLQKIRAYICNIYKVIKEGYTCRIEDEDNTK